MQRLTRRRAARWYSWRGRGAAAADSRQPTGHEAPAPRGQYRAAVFGGQRCTHAPGAPDALALNYAIRAEARSRSTDTAQAAQPQRNCEPWQGRVGKEKVDLIRVDEGARQGVC